MCLKDCLSLKDKRLFFCLLSVEKRVKSLIIKNISESDLTTAFRNIFSWETTIVVLNTNKFLLNIILLVIKINIISVNKRK